LRPDQAALSVSSLSYAFGARPVLQDVSFQVRPGDFAVLLGLNGAGKTTLFALITRLYSARAGSIAVFGHDMETTPRPALARLGVVFQQPTLDLDLTVEQNLFYHAALHGLGRAQARPRIDEELERVGLATRARDRARALSGGQRRRVELARALLHRPSLLLMDEPTVGLDPESRAFLLAHVQTLCGREQLGILWATHLMDEASAESRTLILHKGKLMADTPTSDLSSLRETFTRLTHAA